MSDEDDRESAMALGPAEESLRALLAPLRGEQPVGELPAEPIVRRARWQRTVRSALSAVGTVAASVADGARVVLGAGTGAAKRDPR